MTWKQTGEGSFKTFKKEPESKAPGVIGGIVVLAILFLMIASCAGS